MQNLWENCAKNWQVKCAKIEKIYPKLCAHCMVVVYKRKKS